MKLLYSVGADSGDGHLALRYSLRSVERFASNCEQVIVVGCPPDWLSRSVVSLQVKPDARKYKQQNILDAILAAIDAGLVEGEFLYSSDDHFLIRDVDFDDFPYYYKADELPSFNEIVGRDGLRGWAGVPRSLTQTRDLLLANKYPARNWSGHVNTHLDTRDAAEVRRLVGRYSGAKYGYEPTCLFMNVRARRDPSLIGTFREDCKISKFTSVDDLLAEIGDSNTFSIAGGLLDREPGLQAFLEQMYPQPSRYERGAFAEGVSRLVSSFSWRHENGQ